MGWGWIPPQTRQSSWQGVPTHPGRGNASCLSPGPPRGFTAATATACVCRSGSRIMEGQARAMSVQHWAGTQTEAMACQKTLGESSGNSGLAELERSSPDHQGYWRERHPPEPGAALQVLFENLEGAPQAGWLGPQGKKGPPRGQDDGMGGGCFRRLAARSAAAAAVGRGRPHVCSSQRFLGVTVSSDAMGRGWSQKQSFGAQERHSRGRHLSLLWEECQRGP